MFFITSITRKWYWVPKFAIGRVKLEAGLWQMRFLRFDINIIWGDLANSVEAHWPEMIALAYEPYLEGLDKSRYKKGDIVICNTLYKIKKCD